MRVAVCLSGQLRGWELGWINQTRFWNSKKDFSIDFFAHTWSYSWDREGVSQPYVKRDVSVEEFLEFANCFQTKKKQWILFLFFFGRIMFLGLCF